MFFIILTVAYLMGSIPFGPLIAKKYGINLSKVGSGNIGATNSLRVLGKKAGLTVLLLDVLKGIIPVWIGHLLGFSNWQVVVIGIMVVFGHLYPVFFKFHGGKGVATAAGVLLVLNPGAILLAVTVFILVYLLSKYVSIASILAALSMFIIQISQSSPWQTENLPITLLSLLFLLVIVYTHRSNITRLLAGKENKLNL